MQHEQLREQLTHLAAGELSGWASWRLRRHIAHCLDCAREWDEIQQLQRALATLPFPAPSQSTPHWPSPVPPESSTWTWKGFAMKHRTALVASVALTLCSVSGVFAARYFKYIPFRDIWAGKNTVWTATPHFRGEVRFYTPELVSAGSVSSEEGTVLSGGMTKPTADLEVNGTPYTLTGAGRQPIKSSTGELLGYAELIPQTKTERAIWRNQHDRENGIEEPLHLNYGSQGGYGIASGFFGDGKNRLSWRFHGVGTIRFYHANTGRQAYQVQAFPVDDDIRTEYRKTMNEEEYAMTVADTLPKEPTVEWTVNGQTQKHDGYTPFLLTLPGGKQLKFTIEPPRP